MLVLGLTEGSARLRLPELRLLRAELRLLAAEIRLPLAEARLLLAKLFLRLDGFIDRLDDLPVADHVLLPVAAEPEVPGAELVQVPAGSLEIGDVAVHRGALVAPHDDPG